MSATRNVINTNSRNGLDNLIQESSPDVGTTTHVYDTAGNRIQSTDARGVVVQYTYDALNRQLTTTYPGSTSENAVFAYDTGTNGKGQLTSMTDPSGTTTWTYDHRGNVLSESRTTGSNDTGGGLSLQHHRPDHAHHLP